MSINERLKEIAEFEKKNGGSFHKKINQPSSTTSTIINGTRSPSTNFTKSVFEAYPNLNFRWLFFGEGEMFLQDIERKYTIEKLYQNKKLSDENFGLLLKLYEKKENEVAELRQQLEELRRQLESEK